MSTPADATQPTTPPVVRRGPVRRLYDWTLSWADRPGGTYALFGLAVAESSFFPIPPDVLLMALSLGRPRRALWFALVCTVGSVIGGVIGYFIGLLLFEQIGRPVLEFYHAMETFQRVKGLYEENLVLALGSAAFTPIPFKVFTIAGGAFEVPLVPFIIVSAIGRAGRFFLVASLLRWFGPPIKTFIDKYFNILTLAFFVLLALGFYVIKFMAS